MFILFIFQDRDFCLFILITVYDPVRVKIHQLNYGMEFNEWMQNSADRDTRETVKPDEQRVKCENTNCPQRD